MDLNCCKDVLCDVYLNKANTYKKQRPLEAQLINIQFISAYNGL